MKKIIVITGPIGSGKDTFADLLAESLSGVSIERHDYSEVMKETLDLWFLQRTRENFRKLTNLMEHNFGRGTLAKAINTRVEKAQAEVVLVTGARRTIEVEYLRKLPNCTVIYITADPEIRYERTKASKVKTGEPPTFEAFLQEEQEDTEKEIPEIGKSADITIENNGDLEELKKQVTSFLTTDR
jgi:dephospho-CoA kinase